MDCLENKAQDSFNYTSRYSPFFHYYNTFDDKYMYGTTSHLNQDTDYILHDVSDYDTFDSISLKYYGRPDLFWVIADFNRIQDSFLNLHKSGITTLKVPSIAGIEYEK